MLFEDDEQLDTEEDHPESDDEAPATLTSDGDEDDEPDDEEDAAACIARLGDADQNKLIGHDEVRTADSVTTDN